MHYFLSRNLMRSFLAIEEQVVQIRQLPWVRYLPVVFGRGNVVPLWAQLSILNTQSGFFPHKSVLFQQTLRCSFFSFAFFFFSIACFDFFCLFVLLFCWSTQFLWSWPEFIPALSILLFYIYSQKNPYLIDTQRDK